MVQGENASARASGVEVEQAVVVDRRPFKKYWQCDACGYAYEADLREAVNTTDTRHCVSCDMQTTYRVILD
jgi:hypothetical protein